LPHPLTPTWGGGRPTVHHLDYPKPDPPLVDAELSQDMDALLRLVSLGSAARNAVKIKVRQPLASLSIQAGNTAEANAVLRFFGQIQEELNIKKVMLVPPGHGPLLKFDVKLNMKNAGPKLGSQIKAAQTALASANAAEIAIKVQAATPLELPGVTIPLEPTDFTVTPVVQPGLAGLFDKGTQLLLDARITPELAREGMAREVIRHVQSSRKEADLQMEDRIVLYLHTDDAELAKAIAAHLDYMGSETLVAQWSEKPLGDKAFRAQVKLDGKTLTIELRKV
jgi:isoleucyl-tRNA synthetase